MNCILRLTGKLFISNFLNLFLIIVRNYPLVSMNIQAPLQIENLLPYDIKYLVYDRTTKQNHVDTLTQGSVDSIHIVNRAHILAMSVQLLKSDFKPSSVSLISNTGVFVRILYSCGSKYGIRSGLSG